MKTLTGSLAALAIIAAREGQWNDVARLLVQASHAPDSSEFLLCQLSDNVEANALVNVCADPCESVSASSESLTDSVLALSASLETNAKEELHKSLYGDEEFHSLSEGDDEEPEDEDDDLLLDENELDEIDYDGEDEESNDDGEFSTSSSGMRLSLN